MSHYKELTRVDQLRIEHPNLDNYILSLTDIIAKLEVNNIDLTDKVTKLENEKTDLAKRHIELEDSLAELRKYHKEVEGYTARVYAPNKSYKELEDKLALAENSKQTAIDDLYETQIIPLKNQVKDRDIQLESKYKQEIRHGEQIRSLKSTIDNLNTIINYAVGYISACEQFREYHPQYVKLWLFKGMKDNQ